MNICTYIVVHTCNWNWKKSYQRKHLKMQYINAYICICMLHMYIHSWWSDRETFKQIPDPSNLQSFFLFFLFFFHLSLHSYVRFGSQFWLSCCLFISFLFLFVFSHLDVMCQPLQVLSMFVIVVVVVLYVLFTNRSTQNKSGNQISNRNRNNCIESSVNRKHSFLWAHKSMK